jgi:hypothetical protein
MAAMLTDHLFPRKGRRSAAARRLSVPWVSFTVGNFHDSANHSGESRHGAARGIGDSRADRGFADADSEAAREYESSDGRLGKGTH